MYLKFIIFAILGFARLAPAAEATQNFVGTFDVSCVLQELSMEAPHNPLRSSEIRSPVMGVDKFLGYGLTLDCRIINRMSYPLRLVLVEELKNTARTETVVMPAQASTMEHEAARWLSGRSLVFMELPALGSVTLKRQTHYETTYMGRISWVEVSRYQSQLLKEVSLHFLCIGIFTVAAIVNFFTALLQKTPYTRTYLAYTLLAIVSSLFMTGHLRMPLERMKIPLYVWYSDFFPLLMSACLLVFTAQYLDLKRDYPKLRNSLLALAILGATQALMTPYLHRIGFAYVHDLFYYLCSAFVMLMGFYRVKRKDLAVWYFLSSLTFLAIGSSVYSLSKASIIPSFFAFEFGFTIGIGGALLIASAGLIARGDLMRREWETYLRHQNHFLEARVQEEMNNLRVKERHLEESRRSESVAQLAAGIAHEINNPLAIVGMGISMLERLINRRGEDFTREKDLIRRINHSSERIAKIVGIIRILADKKRGFSVEPCDLRDLTDSMMQLFRERCESLQIKFVVELQGERFYCNASRSHTAEVLISVIQNAVDYLEKETGERWIRLSLLDDPHPVIAISNSGSPIPDDLLPFLFQPFFTTKEPGKGQGLGLCHARSLMETQGGYLSYSVVDGHTCFVVRFAGAGLVTAAA